LPQALINNISGLDAWCNTHANTNIAHVPVAIYRHGLPRPTRPDDSEAGISTLWVVCIPEGDRRFRRVFAVLNKNAIIGRRLRRFFWFWGVWRTLKVISHLCINPRIQIIGTAEIRVGTGPVIPHRSIRTTELSCVDVRL
jgi:hypothetical protein